MPHTDPRYSVLLVSARSERFHAAAKALEELQPALRLEWTRFSCEAAWRLLVGRWRLVLVDAAIDDGDGRALMRHLTRWRPALPVISLADTRHPGPWGHLPAQSLWDDLDAALRRSLALRAPPPQAPTPQ